MLAVLFYLALLVLLVPLTLPGWPPPPGRPTTTQTTTASRRSAGTACTTPAWQSSSRCSCLRSSPRPSADTSLNGLPTSPAQRDSHPVRVRRGCLPAGLTAVTDLTIR